MFLTLACYNCDDSVYSQEVGGQYGLYRGKHIVEFLSQDLGNLMRSNLSFLSSPPLLRRVGVQFDIKFRVVIKRISTNYMQ